MIKRHRKITLVILISLLMILFIPAIAYADTDSPNNAMLPSSSSLFNGQNNNKYLDKYRDNYYLDMKETGMFKSFDFNIFNMLANGIFKLENLLAYVVIIIVFYAFQLNLYDIFSPLLNSVSTNLKTGVYNELSLVCISLLGIFYVVKMVKDQKTQVWVAIIETLTVIVLAMWILNNPSQLLKNIDSFSSGMSQEVLDGTYKATNNGQTADSASIAVCNNLWVMFVHKPWQVLEFGNTTLAEKNEDKILSLPPGNKDRQDYINNLAQDGAHFQPGWGLDRFIVGILYFLIFIVMAIIILLFSGLMLAYQVLIIVVAMFAVFVLLISLIPFFGIRTLQSWFSKILGYSGMKVIISFLLSIIFSFELAIYSLSDKYSIFVIMLIQVIVIVTVWWKREELLEAILNFSHNARAAYESPKNAHKLVRKNVSIENGIRRKFKRDDYGSGSYDGSSGANGGTVRSGNSGNQNVPGGAAGSNSSGNQNGSGNSGNKNGYNKSTNSNDRDNQNQYENYNQPNSWNGNVYGKNDSSSNNDLRALIKIAEDILEHKYEISKAESEEKAKRLNKEVEYSYFVQSAMNREKMNLPKFEDRDKLAVVNQIKSIQQSGGKIEELYNNDKNPTEINDDVERPKEIIVSHNGVEEVITKEEVQMISDQSATVQYTSEFNDVYEKKYDEKFMENLIKKYGRENVRNILDQMKRINTEEKIQNPAGYLTKSLKNNAMNGESIRNKEGGSFDGREG